VEPMAPALEVVTLAVPGFIPLVGGVTTTFVPPGGHMGAPAGSPLPASPTSESVLLFEPPVTESSMVPFRLSSGPLDWPSSGNAGATRFILDDSREEKLWQHAGRQGLEAQETLARHQGPCCPAIGGDRAGRKAHRFWPAARNLGKCCSRWSYFLTAGGFCDRATVLFFWCWRRPPRRSRPSCGRSMGVK
jgi:hypothetical protein